MIPLFKDPASGALDLPENRLGITYYGNSTIILNNPADQPEDSMFLDDIGISPVDDAVLENKQGKDGMEAYQFFKNGLMIRMRGIIHAPTQARLYDRAETLAHAFDPALLSRRTEATTLGFRKLVFNVPTQDTTNFPTGLMECFYYARALSSVTFARSNDAGYNQTFEIEMLVRDPRRYLLALSTRTNEGAMNNLVADYPSWPTVTITMTGAGRSPNNGVRNSGSLGGAKTLWLDLTGCVNGDVITVDMERRIIKKNGNLAMNLYDSGDYWEVEPSNNTQSFEVVFNTGINLAATSVTWYPAFVK